MRHRVKGKKLNRNSQSRKALLRELSKGLLKHGKIKTTLVKAKYVRPHVEKLITISKKNDLSARRRLIADLQDKELVVKVLEEIGPKYKDINGGYSRIRRTGFRMGDSTEMAEISLVEIKIDNDTTEKSKSDKKASKDNGNAKKKSKIKEVDVKSEITETKLQENDTENTENKAIESKSELENEKVKKVTSSKKSNSKEKE